MILLYLVIVQVSNINIAFSNLAFIILVFSFFISTISLIFTHDRYSRHEREKCQPIYVYELIYSKYFVFPFNFRLPAEKEPLPDIFLDNVESVDYLLYVTEIQIIIVVNLCIIIIFFHKKR
jgi:hypothetical protein